MTTTQKASIITILSAIGAAFVLQDNPWVRLIGLVLTTLCPSPLPAPPAPPSGKMKLPLWILLLALLCLPFGNALADPVKHHLHHLTGWIQDKSGIKKPQFVHHPAYAATRAQLKLWDHVDMRNLHLPECYDQGQEGSCTGNGCAFVLAYAHYRSAGQWLMFSRAMLYYDARIPEGSTDSDAGATIADVVAGAVKYGACLELQFPYIVGGFATKPPPAAYTAGLGFAATKTYNVDNTDKTSIKIALVAHLPVIFGSSVYQEIDDLTTTSYVLPMPKPGEQPEGGHCRDIVGYDDRPAAIARAKAAGATDGRGTYIVRNSWGADWGLAGYSEDPQQYEETASISGDFWVLSAAK